jgi:CRISPR-associated protein Csm3
MKKYAQAKLIAQVFGISGDANAADLAEELGPTRISVWDAHLTENWINERLINAQSFTEAKSENVIDRIKGVAEHPRQSERVPSGAQFNFKITIRQLENDNTEQLLNTVLSGLKMLELDGIGSGSRGYGKIKFIGLKQNNQDIQQKFDQLDAFA